MNYNPDDLVSTMYFISLFMQHYLLDSELGVEILSIARKHLRKNEFEILVEFIVNMTVVEKINKGEDK